MSHIPDGLLHAYLDGALDHLGEGESTEVREHLEACAECRARLEQERELRAAAGALLADAEPVVPAMPSFEELRRRAVEAPEAEATTLRSGVDGVSPRPGSARRKGPPRGWGLAWAATIALSLGLGWAGRGMWADPASPLRSSAPTSEATEAVLQTAGERQESPSMPSAESFSRRHGIRRSGHTGARTRSTGSTGTGVPAEARGG